MKANLSALGPSEQQILCLHICSRSFPAPYHPWNLFYLRVEDAVPRLSYRRATRATAAVPAEAAVGPTGRSTLCRAQGTAPSSYLFTSCITWTALPTRETTTLARPKNITAESSTLRAVSTTGIETEDVTLDSPPLAAQRHLLIDERCGNQLHVSTLLKGPQLYQSWRQHKLNHWTLCEDPVF